MFCILLLLGTYPFDHYISYISRFYDYISAGEVSLKAIGKIPLIPG